MDERLAGLGSVLASLMFLWAVVREYFPSHFDSYLAKRASKIVGYLSPYVQITIPEYAGDLMKRSEAYAAVESYLTASCSQNARKLKAEVGKGSSNLLLSMDDHEEVCDEFLGAQLWWSSSKSAPRSQVISFYPTPEERRSYKLTFHKRQRDLVIASYLAHVIKEGKDVRVKNRERKLYTNNASSKYGRVWSHVVFEHPATFDTVAMDPDRKKDIMADLDVFRKGKEYYARVGKAWKRGYLLYGPPGTGKSTMIGAIANYLDYDVYDVELTTVKTNTDLRRLLIETTGKSVIVIEDIDCSLDLTGKRKQKPKAAAAEEEGSGEKKSPGEEEKDEGSKVTLSGLLNFIDGLWSACGGERLFVFTTNHIEKLDPALIRRGRMDKHIEMSYCTFEAFRVLACNYLGVESHRLFETIERLLVEERIMITPADVAENLMPSSIDEDVESRLQSLIEALIKAKEEAATAAAAAAAAAAAEAGGEGETVENDAGVEAVVG